MLATNTSFKTYVKALLRDVASSRDSEEKLDALHSLFATVSMDRKRFIRELPGMARTSIMELLKKCHEQDASFNIYYNKLVLPSFF